MIYREVTIAKRSEWNEKLAGHTMFFVPDGGIELSINDLDKGYLIRKNSLFLLPGNTRLSIKTKKSTTLLLLYIRTNIRSFRHLLSDTENYDYSANEIHILPVMPVLYCFLDVIRACNFMEKELGVKYMEVKMFELLNLMKHNYSSDDLGRMFVAILQTDHEFVDFVTNNFLNVKTVGELASLYNSSLSVFYKLFHKNFNQSPYSWMKKQRDIRLHHAISHSDMTMTEISDMFGFSSLSQFSTYCKKNLGDIPSRIRKNG